MGTFSAEPGRREAAAWGAVLGYAAAAMAVLRNLLLVPLYLHFVPLAQYGAWLATGASLVQIVVTDYGLAGVLMQRASAAHGAGSHAELGPLIRTGLLAAVGLAVVLSCVSVAVVPLLMSASRLMSADPGRLEGCVLLAVLANAIGIVGVTAQGFVRSMQHARLAGSITLLADLLNIVTTVGLLFGGAGLYALPAGLVVRSTVLTLVLGSYLLRRRPSAVMVPALERWRLLKMLFVDSWHSLILSLAMKVQTQGNTFFVGVLLGPQSAAAYGLTVRAHETLQLFSGLANSALLPSMAHLLGSGSLARFRQLMLRVVPILTLGATLGLVVVAAENRAFVDLWVGHGVFAGQAVSILACVAMLVATIGFTGYDSLYALGDFRFIAGTFVLTAVVHVALLIGLARLGLWTVPLVMIASSVIWGTAFLRRACAATGLKRHEGWSVVADVLRITLCGCAAAAIFALLPQPHHWWSLCAVALLCVATFLLAVLCVGAGLRDVIREEFSTTVRSMLRRP